MYLDYICIYTFGIYTRITYQYRFLFDHIARRFMLNNFGVIKRHVQYLITFDYDKSWSVNAKIRGCLILKEY